MNLVPQPNPNRAAIAIVTMVILGGAGIYALKWYAKASGITSSATVTATASVTAAKTGGQPIPPTPTPTPDLAPLNYSIVSNTTVDGKGQIEVYTTETTDARLIQLNDLLVAQYSPGSSNFSIDYFDDKTAAATYWAKENDPTVSDAVKSDLHNHYVAGMIYDAAAGLKQLQRPNAETVAVLKTY